MEWLRRKKRQEAWGKMGIVQESIRGSWWSRTGVRKVDGSTGSGGVRSWRDCDVPSAAESMGSVAELLAEIIILLEKRQSCWWSSQEEMGLQMS